MPVSTGKGSPTTTTLRRTALGIQSTFVADADGMGIVMAGVHAYLFLGTGLVDLAIALDVIVVADAFSVESGVVTVLQHLEREALVSAGGRTMDDDQ